MSFSLYHTHHLVVIQVLCGMRSPCISFSESVIAHIFCCTFAVSPKKGDALLFFSLHPDATTDPSSLHGSCPVIAGKKWSATKWIHVRSFDKSLKPGATGECVDEDEHCPKWASVGECEKNPVYMVGI